MDVGVRLVGALDLRADAADALGGLVELLGERQRLFVFELGEALAVDAVGAADSNGRRRRREALRAEWAADRGGRSLPWVEFLTVGKEGRRPAHGRRRPEGWWEGYEQGVRRRRSERTRARIMSENSVSGKTNRLARPLSGVANIYSRAMKAGPGRSIPMQKQSSSIASIAGEWEGGNGGAFFGRLRDSNRRPRTASTSASNSSSDPELSITWLARRRFSSIGNLGGLAPSEFLVGPAAASRPGASRSSRGGSRRTAIAVQTSFQPASMSSGGVDDDGRDRRVGQLADGRLRSAGGCRGGRVCSRNSRSAAPSGVSAKTILRDRRAVDAAVGAEDAGAPAGDERVADLGLVEHLVAELVGVEHDGAAAGQRGGDGRSCRWRRRR